MSTEKKEKPHTLTLPAIKAEACVGHMHMTMEGATVSQGKTKLGTISPIVGGGVEVRFADGFGYHISLAEIWKSAADAHEKWKKDNGG